MTNGLSIDGDRLLRDGADHRVVSGAIHYFRVHPDLWRDRLERLRAMGCNAVETYVPWNFHQPREDVAASFDGWRDLGAFISTAGDLGLDVIVRPGPYICAEWDFGGLPAWLLRDENLRIRCQDSAYLAAVDVWFDALIPMIAAHQVSRGGPVVAVQVENEYGSYGNDRGYLAHVERGLRERGIDCLLFTSDGPTHRMLSGGTLPDMWATTNFGSRPDEAFELSRAFRPAAPQMCMEFWNGWFDHWGEPHHVRDGADAAEALEGILAQGASVNIYMAHGGTNFEWWAGANHADALAGGTGYQPTVTSYDYDAPIGEAGELTKKFHDFREIIGRYVPLPDVELPAPLPRVAPQTVVAEPTAALRDHVEALSGGAPVRRPTPENMEKLGHSHGLVLYRTHVAGPAEKVTLHVDGVHDLAQVFGNGKLLGTLDRDAVEQKLELDVPDQGLDLELLVEPFGRVNFGPHVIDRKGLIGGVRIDYQHQFGWDISVLPLDDADGPLEIGNAADAGADAARITTEGPVFFRATVDLPEPADAFVEIAEGTRGLVWLNGFLLGRYWERGPQKTLYAPGPLWRAGANEIVVLETDTSQGVPAERVIEIRDEPDLGPVSPPMVYS